MLEDGYNRQWQAMVHFGRSMTADESRIAGWYHSPMTMGPEPKPIRTGCTLHTLCVTYGILATYKLFARAYGGKTDSALDHRNINTHNTQKWVNLYDIMLDPFKGAGRCVTMDSAYMGDIMAQIGRFEWGVNMVGTAQANRSGAGEMINEKKKDMAINSFETTLIQHNSLPLLFSMWADNNFVRTLSNFHPPEIIENGIKRRRKIDGVRERTQTPVRVPVQQKYYSETFHLIDKGNQNETHYDMGFESHCHGWTPKLAFRYFNMNLNNAYKIYEYLIATYTPERRFLDMGESVELACDALMQKGEPMRQRATTHPHPVRNLSLGVFDTGSGRKIRSDAKGRCLRYHGHAQNQSKNNLSLKNLKRKQRTHPWCTHQSIAFETRNHCSFKGCPGLKSSKDALRPRGTKTFMRCQECSAEQGTNVFFCNDTSKGKPQLCHYRYHTRHCSTESVSP